MTVLIVGRLIVLSSLLYVLVVAHPKRGPQVILRGNNEYCDSSSGLNLTPVVGILAQETDDDGPNGPASRSYIAASYVKWIETSGARVVPIMIGQNFDYYDEMTNYINGILLPGGAAAFNNSHGYAEAGGFLYTLAKNKRVPLWGTCLGMELIMNLECNADVLEQCDVTNIPKNVNLEEDFRDSDVFRDAPIELTHIIQNENVAYNNHEVCTYPKTLLQKGCLEQWKVLGTNVDGNNRKYLSIVESRDYQIYATQFHPEKNIFEWKTDLNIPHSENAVWMAQYLGEAFLRQVRKNCNPFSKFANGNDNLIYEYQPEYTAKLNSSFMQKYFFDRRI